MLKKKFLKVAFSSIVLGSALLLTGCGDKSVDAYVGTFNGECQRSFGGVTNCSFKFTKKQDDKLQMDVYMQLTGDKGATTLTNNTMLLTRDGNYLKNSNGKEVIELLDENKIQPVNFGNFVLIRGE